MRRSIFFSSFGFSRKNYFRYPCNSRWELHENIKLKYLIFEVERKFIVLDPVKTNNSRVIFKVNNMKSDIENISLYLIIKGSEL